MRGWGKFDIKKSRRKTGKQFIDFLGPEDHLHHAVITWVGLAYPKLKYHHSPLEGRRTPFEQYKMKYLGTDEGFIDLIFPGIQLVIELKIWPRKPTAAQQAWLDYFKSLGWTTAVCYEFDGAKNTIIETYTQFQKKYS